jgi:hypothetical protein
MRAPLKLAAIAALCCFCLGLCIGCTEQAPTVVEMSREETAGTLGFVVTTRATGRTLVADKQYLMTSISCPLYADPLPTVYLNDTLFHRGSSGGAVLSWFRLSEEFGATITYRIAWQSDVLVDSFVVPHRVDSFFCNGYPVRNNATQAIQFSSLVDTVPVDSLFRLRWLSQGAPYYSITVSCKVMGAERSISWSMSRVQSQDSLNVAAQHDSGQVISMSVAIAACADSVPDFSRGAPSRSSGRVHAYRDIEGGYYGANIWRLGY